MCPVCSATDQSVRSSRRLKTQEGSSPQIIMIQVRIGIPNIPRRCQVRPNIVCLIQISNSVFFSPGELRTLTDIIGSYLK
jgi:hypothetical protein